MATKTRAQIAYEAYFERAGGKSLATGQSLPYWDALPVEIKEAWEAAATAVVKSVGQDLLRYAE
ncbi:MAG: hypothetical protein KJZ78_10530 [Bryobacteraceae bacterium]|nr:hypothetical protein [Bryobacteraceae bacterium]